MTTFMLNALLASVVRGRNGSLLLECPLPDSSCRSAGTACRPLPDLQGFALWDDFLDVVKGMSTEKGASSFLT